MICTEHLLNAGIRTETSKKGKKNPPHNCVKQNRKERKKRKREREAIRTMGLAFLKGSCEREKEPTPWEATYLTGRSAKMEGPQSHQEKHSSWIEEDKAE